MLPWIRPPAHDDFASDGAKLLNKVRLDIAGGVPHRDIFTNREIWSGTWKRRQQPKGLHKIQLAGPAGRYEAKCVWCERRRDLSRELDVEHFRPKAGVSELRGDYDTTIDTPPPQHPLGTGYWWLAFTWDNYTLACKTCNQTWKRNLFPVRVPRPDCVEGVENQEIPLLINPASDFRTHEHFRWDEISGIIEGISEEGNATIITCGLNRIELVSARQKVARDTSQVIVALVRAFRREDHEAERELLRKLQELVSMSAEFTSMTRWIAEQTFGSWDELSQLLESYH